MPAANALAAAPGGHAVPYVEQVKDQWCWAACFEMMRGFLQLPSMTQLEIATAYFGNSACANPDAATCNAAAFPNFAAASCGLYCQPRNRPLDLGELAAELANGPVQAYFRFGPGSAFSGHVAIIAALRPDGTVTLLDPWRNFGISYPTVAQLQSDYHGGNWEKSYVRYRAA